MVEGVEADVFADGSLELLRVVGGWTFVGRVFIIIQIDVILFLGLLTPTFVVVEDGGVELIDFLVLLVGSFESIEQVLKVLVVLHPLLGLDQSFLQTLLLVVLLQSLMLLLVGKDSHLRQFLLPHDALEPALKLLYSRQQQFFLSFEDGHVFVVKVHFVVLQKDLQIIHFLLAFSPFWCFRDHLLQLVHLLMELL